MAVKGKRVSGRLGGIDYINGLTLAAMSLVEKKWLDNFEKLKIYRQNNNNWPNYDPSNPDSQASKLGAWLSNQKNALKKGKLPAEKIEELKSINYDLSSSISEIRERIWKEKYEDYIVYLESEKENRSLSIKDYNRTLYTWVQEQRKAYAANPELFDDWKKQLLNDRDFKWNPDEIWNGGLEELKQFLLEYKHKGIKSMHKTNYQIYIWVRNQLKNFRKGTLREDRTQQLLLLGLIFTKGIKFNKSIVDSLPNEFAITDFNRLSDKTLVKLKENLSKLIQTDYLRETPSRQEQGWQRDILFYKKTESKCAFCKNVYPISFMVAAHIKKRQYCNLEERLDLNIVIPACKFGCDELFEKRYIAVKKGKIVDLKMSPTTESIQKKIDKLFDNTCDYFSTATEKYFEFHYNPISPSL